MSVPMLDAQRRRLLVGGGAFLGAVALAAAASKKPEPFFKELEGRKPLMRHGKVVVTEFFSFGCPFCARFAGPLAAWAQNVAHEAAVDVVHVGAGRAQWENLGMVFYALQEMGVETPFIPVIFHEMETKGPAVFDNYGMHWAKRQDFDLDKYLAALKTAPDKLAAADRLMQDCGVSSVPSLVIGGRYVIRGAATRETFDMATETIRRVAREA